MNVKDLERKFFLNSKKRQITEVVTKRKKSRRSWKENVKTTKTREREGKDDK